MRRQTDPWAHREPGWSAGIAAQAESLLALSNGYLGIRGTLDEGEPAAVPGTYLAGVHALRPIPYAERGYGDPESDQILAGVADGTRIRLAADGERLDVRTGTVLEHERILDLRAGLLTRALHWRAPEGADLLVRTRRLVSLEHREIAAIEYRVEAPARPVRVSVRSELCTPRSGEDRSADPRKGSPLPSDALAPRASSIALRRAVLAHETRGSGFVVAAGMDHEVESAHAAEEGCAGEGDEAHWSLTTTVVPGEPLCLVKFLAYHWATGGEPQALMAATGGSLDTARRIGFAELARKQRAALDAVWEHADIELDGDPEVQHALRYALFQLHQNAACAGGRAIPAKGLTGPGYSGHSFWDTEIFVLPALTACAPRHAADALRWRASTLPRARRRARRLGLQGAAFPWRTIDGEECSGYLPAGTAAFHVNADIAHAVIRHIGATGDERFAREVGAPLLIETARLWTSLGYHDPRRDGRFSIDGVTGPDEYSPLVDNNLYTDLMAQENLRGAADAVERLGRLEVGVAAEEIDRWRAAADAMVVPVDAGLGIHLQDEDFTRHAPFDFAGTPASKYPLIMHVPYVELYRRQVVKQADLVLAMVLHPQAFTAEQKRANFAYYERLTVRDSSLSAGVQAVMAAQLGDVQLAHDYLAEAILLDHHDTAHNTADGLHLAALASGWIAVVAGLAGAREHQDRLSFAPRLPDGMARVAFSYAFRGRRLHITLDQRTATYGLRRGEPLAVEHYGHLVELVGGGDRTLPIPPAGPLPAFEQPPGRAPASRRLRSHATL